MCNLHCILKPQNLKSLKTKPILYKNSKNLEPKTFFLTKTSKNNTYKNCKKNYYY